MLVVPISAFSNNYIWAIINRNTREFDCIDPGDAQPVLDFAQSQSLKLRAILLTHHHHDHIGGVNQLLKDFPQCLVYGPKDTRIPFISHEVEKDQIIQRGHYSLQILFNPGHTSSHISYYEPQQGWLFCGDTLFSAGCGRVFDGTIEQLHQSLLLFKQLPPKTKIYCAHEYTLQNLRFAQTVEPSNKEIATQLQKITQSMNHCSLPSTLALELSINPFMRTQIKEVIQYAQNQGATSLASLDVFTILRHQKNNFN